VPIEVSIIIINYNTFAITCDCLKSVIESIKGVSYEIILVDNCSTEKLHTDFVEMFPQIKLIASDRNLGYSKGNNLGIENAKGEYILLLNNDTILKNDAVSIAKKFLDSNSNVAVAGARLEYPDGRVQHSCQRFPSIKYQLFELLRFQKIFPSKRQTLFGSFFSYNSIAFPDWVWGTFFMFRRELLGKLPNSRLADDFFMYAEDTQWCLEFKRLGYRIAFVPDAIVVHLMGQSGGAKALAMVENKKILLERYYNPVHRTCILFLEKCLQWSQR
jgi:GT2 family glycosyltransferase